MENTTNNTPNNATMSRRQRRNSTIKTIVIWILALIVLGFILYSCRGCTMPAIGSNNGTVTDTTCKCGKCEECSAEALPEDVRALQAELEYLRNAYANALLENEEHAKEIAELTEKLNKANSSATSWQNKYNSHVCTSTNGNHDNCVTVTKYNELVAKYNELCENYKDLKAIYDALLKQNNSIDLSKYVLKSELTAVQQKLTKAEAEIKALTQELTKWSNHKCSVTDHSSCNTEIAALKSTIVTLKAHSCDHSECKSKIDTLEALVRDYQNHKCPGADHSTCNSKIATLEREIASLKNHSCDHSNCIAKVVYDALVRDYNALKAEHAKCSEWSEGNWNANGSVNGDYSEGDYDAGSNNGSSSSSSDEIWIDENGNIYQP